MSRQVGSRNQEGSLARRDYVKNILKPIPNTPKKCLDTTFFIFIQTIMR
jgi:hypothetical protein